MPDGSITFSTELDNKALEKDLAKAKKKIGELERSIEQTKSKRNPLAEQAEELAARLDAAKKKLEELKGARASSATDIASQKETVDALQALWNKAQGQVDRYDASIKKASASLDAQKAAANEAVKQLAGAQTAGGSAKLESALTRAKSIAAQIPKALGNGVASARKLTSTLGKGVKSAGGMLSKMLGFGKHAKKANSVVSDMAKRLKSLVVAAFVFNVIRKGLAQLRDYMGSLLKTNDGFVNSLNAIKVNLATAFQPIFEAVLPAINALMSALARISAYVASFISLLFGKTYAESKAAAQALNEQAEALDDTGGAAKKAGKQLAAFDEINMLSRQQEAGGGADDGLASLFEQPEVPEVDISWLDTFKQKLFDLEADLGYFSDLGKVIGEKITSGLDRIPWDKIKAAAGSIAQKLAALLNGAVAGINWGAIGNAIAQAFNTALIFAYDFLTTFDWMSFGRALASGINSMFANFDWALLGATAAAWVMAWFNSLYGLYMKLDWKLIGESVGNAINSFFANLDFKRMAETVNAGILGALSMIGEAIRAIDWKKIGEDVKTFLVNIDWNGIANELFRALGNAFGGLVLFLTGLIGDAWNAVIDHFSYWIDVVEKAGGDIVSGLLLGIVMGLANIGNWIKEYIFQPFIDGFCELFGINSPSKVMRELGVYIMQGLLNGVKSLVDTVVGLFSGMWNGIKSVWSVVAGWFNRYILTPLTGGFRAFVNGITGFFEGMANGVISIFESLINWIIKAINKISFKLPDLLGGATIGFNLSSVSLGRISIPRLAQGAVIPPNREFLAVLGDQKSGTNIETPEALLRQIYREESGSGEIISVLRDLLAAVREGKIIAVDRQVLGKVVNKTQAESFRTAGGTVIPI